MAGENESGTESEYAGILSPEELASFNQQSESGSAAVADAGGEPAPDAGADDAAAAAAAAAAGEGGAEDSDDDGDDDAGQGEGGQQPVARDGQQTAGDQQPREVRRVSRSRHNRIVGEKDETIAQLNARLESEKEERIKVNERLTLLNEALLGTGPGADQQVQNGQAAADAEPELDENGEPKDPFAYMRWQSKKLEQLTDTVQKLQSDRAGEVTEKQVATAYVTDAREFASTEPNFSPAYMHLLTFRTSQLAALQFDKAPNELNQQERKWVLGVLAAEEKGIVTDSLKRNVSPASKIYKMAIASGYRPMTKEELAAQQAGGEQEDGEGGEPAPGQHGQAQQGKPAQNGQQAPSVRGEVERQRRGLQASKSLSQGGGSPPGALSVEKLAKMPQAEFDRMYATDPKALLRQLGAPDV